MIFSFSFFFVCMESAVLTRRPARASVTWQSLQRYLARYSQERPRYRYYREVIEQILGAHAEVAPPQWLVEEYEVWTL
jgi:hypothetical protein